ncbi:transcription termination factor NusA [Ignatzschineria rhizosphaerae]|uniref:Transcription termination/antitermination protein NusA n=1 Tax=Ignatzschineria rhizosphaerae TaxID=2923279 RepID=A0ABY3X272_9GAMM|nr:transcription termination factor NusA [Ignatzschineria rhizosphaerae]UNM95794.1 transcription termination factor NusA [Ignatzschineria rhizosphaerae]
MNNKEIMLVAETVSNEKGISRDEIFAALEFALAAAARRTYTIDVDLRIEINKADGSYRTFRRWMVVEDNLPQEEQVPTRQITLSAAQIDDPEIQVGDFIEDEIDNIPFARIGAQTAKQIIFQKIREAERMQMARRYEHRIGELIRGTVKRIDRGNFYIDIGDNDEAFLAKENMIPRESLRIGNQIRAVLEEISMDNPRGPQIVLSRRSDDLIKALFEIEVPEINQGSIEIIAASRDPGSRAKIAVKTHDQRIDPVGACVGMRGSRVQNITKELAGERVDIVLWDENPVQFVINAMSPAEVLSVVVDEDHHMMDIAVSQDKLSQAIGRGGQNVRLASKLTGWELNVMGSEDAQQKYEKESGRTLDLFMEGLNVDEEVAEILIREGFSTIEEVAYVPVVEMLEIEEFDEDIIEALRDAAVEALNNKKALLQNLGDAAPTPELISALDDNELLAITLAKNNIRTLDDLAELSTDELCELIAIDEEDASKYIMAARQSWFE